MTHIFPTRRTIPSILPQELPIFSLGGAILLPQARLPLNIFEPRYLAMVDDALGKGRWIGMIQPSSPDETLAAPLYAVGCAGRITSFNETEDGGLLIVLTGVCRFRTAYEVPEKRLYRIIRPDWKPYLGDLDEKESPDIDREKLIDLLRVYFKKNAISVDWNSVQNASDDMLVSTAIMICPFPANEKQALLEVAGFTARVALLITLLEMAVMPQSGTEGDVRH